jgi:hypothetical protein
MEAGGFGARVSLPLKPGGQFVEVMGEFAMQLGLGALREE